MAKKPVAQAAPEAKQPEAPAQPQAPGTSMAKIEGDGALILVGDKQDVSHLATGKARGSENVGTEDLVIPRLEIVQGLSEALQPGKPGYIEGAKQGDLINSVTNRNYGREVFIVPVQYAKQWLLWKKYTEGGGFFGAHNSPEEAEDRKKVVIAEGEKEANLEVVDTPQHLCLLVDVQTRQVEEIMIPLAKTKAKVSRAWNTMIRMTGQDRFARVYRFSTAMEKNKKNQEYWNFVVSGNGSPAPVLFKRAETLFEQVSSGKKTYTMDTKGYNEPGDAGSESEM